MASKSEFPIENGAFDPHDVVRSGCIDDYLFAARSFELKSANAQSVAKNKE